MEGITTALSLFALVPDCITHELRKSTDEHIAH
jgi:hypothetical protein